MLKKENWKPKKTPKMKKHFLAYIQGSLNQTEKKSISKQAVLIKTLFEFTHFFELLNVIKIKLNSIQQGAKKVSFTACHLG